MKKLVGISLFVFWAFVTAILTAGLVYYQNSKVSPSNNSVLNSGANDPVRQEMILDATEIAKHGSIQNCWLLINGKIYDVTGYLGAHPGGVPTIAPYCGKEASDAFSTKNTGSSHSASANELLVSYYVGDLNQKIGASQMRSSRRSLKGIGTE